MKALCRLLFVCLFCRAIFAGNLAAQTSGTFTLTSSNVSSIATLSQGQLASLLDTLNAMPTVSADSLPVGASVFSLQNPTWPPYPGVPPAAQGVGLWPLGNNAFLLNDVLVNYDTIQLASPMGRAQAMGAPSPPGGWDGSGGGDDVTNSYIPYSYPTNGLYLQMTGVSNGLAYVNLNNATDSVYEILTKTDLTASTWSIEQELWPTNSSVMPFTIPLYNRTNSLYVWAMDWTAVTENGNTTPDWWFWRYFGALGFSDTNLDTLGNTLLYDYTNGLDPNVIAFTLSATNLYVNQSGAWVQVAVTAGVPSYYAILANDTNLSDAVWQSFTGTNLYFSTPTDGVYNVTVGLRGLPANAIETWQGITLTRDTVPPVITVTNPLVSTVSQPLLQLQGSVSKALSRFTYYLTNAAGAFSNLPVLITGAFPDSNTLTFTTRYFQAADLSLTGGLNRVTLRATDLAGNSAQTNVSITLDYSGDTTAPVLAVTWPQTNDVVAASVFSLTGTVDDPSATIFALDADSVTNAAVVERDGRFTIPGLALTGATNQFTLIATDVAGNTASRQVTVIKSAVTLTLDSPSQLGQSPATVTGTVSDATQQVVVNGVVATVNPDGTWEADNVPFTNNSGTGVFAASVYTPGSDVATTLPLANLSQTLAMPPLVRVAGYVMETLDVTSGSFGSYFDKAVETWQYGVGGDIMYTDTYGLPTDTPVNPYAGPTSGEHEQIFFSYPTPGLLQTTTIKAETSLDVVAGGPAMPGQNRLLRLTVAATNADGTVLPVSSLSVLGQTPTPTATNANVGELYVSQPAGSTQVIPFTVTGSSNYTFGVKAEDVTIVFTNVATTPTNRNRTTIGVCEQVAFTAVNTNTTWSATAGSFILNHKNGPSVTYVAPDTTNLGSQVIITASIPNQKPQQFPFSVISPGSVTLTLVPQRYSPINPNPILLQSNLAIQFYAYWYLPPDNVSFSNLVVSEDVTYATATGYFDTVMRLNNERHNPGKNLIGQQVVPGLGTFFNGQDDIDIQTIGPVPEYSDGTFVWHIPFYYTTPRGTNRYYFTNVDHLATLVGTNNTGTLTLTKGNLSFSVSAP